MIFLVRLTIVMLLLNTHMRASLAHDLLITHTSQSLYPLNEPYHNAYIFVSPIHTLYYAEYGNPQGIPVLVVHGGPGAGCCPEWSAFFDPAFYRVIMLDQRGAGKSLTALEIVDNTSAHLVADMELLRTTLNIERWILFGGSWGSTLSLLYAQSHPDRVYSMVLRGIFLGRKSDSEHLIYDTKLQYPDAWYNMVHAIGASQDDDLIKVLYTKLVDEDPAIQLTTAHAFMRFDTLCGSLLPSPESVAQQAADDHSALRVSRIFIHYVAHEFFIEKNQILRNMPLIEHIPTIIVQGRYDMICPMHTAYTLYKNMPSAALWIVPDAGHFASDPSLGVNLCHAMERMKSYFV